MLKNNGYYYTSILYFQSFLFQTIVTKNVFSFCVVLSSDMKMAKHINYLLDLMKIR